MKSVIQHLRFPFSLLLSPVYFFAWSQQSDGLNFQFFIFFIVLHVLVYPSSNAFNSVHDKDTGSIGGIKKPLPVSSNLGLISNILDALALILTFFFLGKIIFLLVTLYIFVSRLYSHRKVRLKKNPWLSVLIIAIFQGGLVYFMCSLLSESFRLDALAITAVSLQLAAVYPITQIFQYESDLRDGIKSLSFVLGKQNTFYWFFSLSGLGILFYYLHFSSYNIQHFYGLIIALSPSFLFSLWWFRKVIKDENQANFSNTMLLNILSAIALNVFFLILLIINN
jgi:1,4-dihydroxy-2-naphthoate octaprenyltransferase